MAKYEDYEWSQLWYDQTNEDTLPRVMLIGDSITVGYTRLVNDQLKGIAHADSLATSKGLDHPYYEREIELFASQFEFDYRVIHFNNGLHAFHLSAEEYERLLDEKIGWLIGRFPKSKLMLTLCTPLVLDEADRPLDPTKNAVVLARNEAILRIAEKYNLPVDDLYTPMLNHPEWRNEGDAYHFMPEGREAQSKLIAGKISALLG